MTLSEQFGGANASDFSVTGGTCTTTLAAASTCSITVSLAPGVLGTDAATMTITDSPDPVGGTETRLPIIAPPKCASNRGGLGDSLSMRLFEQPTVPAACRRQIAKIVI